MISADNERERKKRGWVGGMYIYKGQEIRRLLGTKHVHLFDGQGGMTIL